MATFGASQKQLQEAQDTAAELIRLLRDWIPKRKRTIRTLRDIATEADNVQENVNVVKAIGYTASVLGGIAGVVGIVMTGGLATPLVVGGVTAAVAGTATTTGATIVGGLVSNKKVNTAQEALDADKRLVEKIEEKKVILERLSTQLSYYFRLEPEECFGLLLMSALTRSFSPRAFPLGSLGIVLVTTELVALTVITQSMKGVGKGMASALGEISLKGLARTIGSVLGVTLGGALVVWDFVKLIETVGEISKGSKTVIASKLQDISRELESQTEELEQLLENVKKTGQDFETLIKEKFRQHLIAISEKGCAESKEADEVYKYICAFTTEEWQQHFTRSGGNLREFVFEIARVFHLIVRQVEQHERKEEDEEGELTVILIAHGRIDSSLMLPVGLYYPTSYMKSVKLYEPWGCGIDASVVYGITANTIQMNNVSYTIQMNNELYSAQVYKYSSEEPSFPTHWNELKDEQFPIPTPMFGAVQIGENAYRDLMDIIGILQMNSDGLVIPYFTGDGNDILPFPEVPLYVITTVLGLIGALSDTHIKLRVAACLSIPEGDNTRHNGIIQCQQYFVVDPAQNVCMNNRFTDVERITIQLMNLNLNNLNQFL